MKKNLWISYANIAAASAVVIMHCNGVFWSFPEGRLWLSSNFIETFFYWAVPVFFMITGATLIDYRDRYDTGTFFRKRFLRTLVPFLFWSVIGFLFHGANIDWSVQYSVKEVLEGILNNRFMSVYWYFMPLFSAYLSIPLLSAVDKKIRIRVYAYCISVYFILSSVLPLMFKLLGMQYNYELGLPVLGGYLVYVLLGYLISRCEIPKRHRMVIYVLAVFGWFLHFYGTHVLSMDAGAVIDTFKGYMNLPAFLHAAGVMVLFRYIPWEQLPERVNQLAVSMQKYTFGIYLVHMYLIMFIPPHTGIDTNSILWRTLGAAVVYVLSLGICTVIGRIPVLKKTIGL